MKAFKMTLNKFCLMAIFFPIMNFHVIGDSAFADNKFSSGLSQVFRMELEVAKAKAMINLAVPDKDQLKVKGKFWLAPDSDDISIAINTEGLRVLNDNITVKFGGRHEFNETIPAGSLVEVKPLSNKYKFEPDSPTGPVHALEIKYDPGSFQGKFWVTWNKLDLVAAPKPTVEDDLMASDPSSVPLVAVPFDLDIGNDNGMEAGIYFELTKDKKDIIEYEFERPEEGKDV